MIINFVEVSTIFQWYHRDYNELYQLSSILMECIFSLNIRG